MFLETAFGKKIDYYCWASYRRIILDKLQERNKKLYRGVVLDIGGKDLGFFKKPRDKVEKWIFADIEKRHKPDLLIDVADMKNIRDESVDVVNALELFEHVEKIDQGLKECYRVLKSGGNMIISVPFLYPVHADPHDFQRWTGFKWKKELKKNGFKIVKFYVMGRYFTVLGDSVKMLVSTLPLWLKRIAYLFYPLLFLLVSLDKRRFVKRNPRLKNFHGGYFIVLKKP